MSSLHSPFLNKTDGNPPEEDGELGNPDSAFECTSPPTPSCSAEPPKSPPIIHPHTNLQYKLIPLITLKINNNFH